MGKCSSTSNCNPCGPDFSAINQLATRAAASARLSARAWLEFNALYLGAFDTPPTTNNQGNPLQVGALYWNSAINQLYAWNGASWQIAANFNEFTPFLAAGTITPRNLTTRTTDLVNIRDFGAVGNPATTQAAMAYAVANNKPVYFDTDTTIRIPTDVPSLQDGLLLVETDGKTQITLFIESGHRLTRGVFLENQDKRNFTIKSADAVVQLDTANFVGFSNAQYDTSSGGGLSRPNNLFMGFYSSMPVLDTLIDMQGYNSYGWWARFCESYIEPGAGIINCGYRAFSATGGNVYAINTLWNGAGSEGLRLQQTCTATFQGAQVNNCQNNPAPGVTLSAIFVSRGSRLHFQDGQARNSGQNALTVHRGQIVAVQADVSGSLQAGTIIHGGHIMFRLGNASGCTSGFRLFAQGKLDASGANLNTSTWSLSLGAGGNEVNAYGASGQSGGGQAILNDIVADNGTPQLNIPFRQGIIYVDAAVGSTWGTYTPTITDTLNVASSTSQPFQFIRVGNIVTVSGEFEATATASNTDARVRLNLPASANFVNRGYCSGAGSVVQTPAGQSVGVIGVTSNNTAEVRWLPLTTNSQDISVTFTYRIS